MIDRKRWKDELLDRVDPDRKKDPETMKWVVSVGEGWKKLVCDLVDKLDRIQPFTILQVKEKFGTLRFYTNTKKEPSKKFIAALERAYKISGRVCEDCGGKGKLRGDGWVRTLCVPCNKAFLKKRQEQFDRFGSIVDAVLQKPPRKKKKGLK